MSTVVIERGTDGLHRWTRYGEADDEGGVEVEAISAAYIAEADCYDDAVRANPGVDPSTFVYEDEAAVTDGGTPGPGNGYTSGPTPGHQVRPGLWQRRDPRP